MGKMFLPVELLILISKLEKAKDEEKQLLINKLNSLLVELVSIKTRILNNDTTLTQKERDET